jgi:DNA mismatch repair protein MutL
MADSSDIKSHQSSLLPLWTEPQQTSPLSAGAPSGPIFPASASRTSSSHSSSSHSSSAFRSEESPAPPLQLHRRFLLVAVRGGYLLLNQQAAHERILYEKALEDLNRSGRAPSQQLLFPELMEFTLPETRLLESHLDRLASLGFELEPFGSRTYQLRGLPPDIGLERAREALGVLLEELGRGDSDGSGAKGAEDLQRQKLAKAYARAAAVPLGMALEPSQMAALVDGLFATRNPYVSPRGAPAVIRTSLAEIHRKFGLPFDPEE